MSNYKINLHQAIYSLSDALDLVGVTHIHHGKRVAYMAVECGKHMGWPAAQLDRLFQAAILHDSGVSKTSVHAKLAQLEWEREGDHCMAGANLLSSCHFLQHLSPIVLHHHTHWERLQEIDMSQVTRLCANLIYLVDRVDVLTISHLAKEDDILLGKDEIRQKILERSGSWFCPELVDAFMDLSLSEAFWFSLEAERVNGYVTTWLAETQPMNMTFDELRHLVRIFSIIVDAKSAFTKEHSDGVANLAFYLGKLFELPEDTCEMLELAGLLHDVGKLRVPDELLEKVGKLTQAESIIMHRHSFDTYNVLKGIHGMERVAEWAGHHHERVDGSGYPYHASSNEISFEARIIAVADVFQALAQHRPYRDSMQPDEIMEILIQEADEGKLDKRVVAKVKDHLQQCWEKALVKREAAEAI